MTLGFWILYSSLFQLISIVKAFSQINWLSEHVFLPHSCLLYVESYYRLYHFSDPYTDMILVDGITLLCNELQVDSAIILLCIPVCNLCLEKKNPQHVDDFACITWNFWDHSLSYLLSFRICLTEYQCSNNMWTAFPLAGWSSRYCHGRLHLNLHM